MDQIKISIIMQYVKAITFENHKNKLVFLKANGADQAIDYQFGVHKASLGEDVHEVVLQVQMTSKVKEDEIFALKVEYSGLFKIEGSCADETKDEILSVNCVTLLFPFIRREIADVLVSGGFQAILIDPVDFRSVYMEYKKQEETKKLEEFSQHLN